MRPLFTNILSNWAFLGLSIVVGFVMLPVLLGRLGQEAYGVIILANTLAGYTNLLRAGLGGAVVQRVARARGQGDASAAGAAASGVFSLYCLLGLAAVLVGSLLAWNLPGWFGISADLAKDAQLFALLTAVLVAIQFPGSVFNGILHGLERYDRANLSMGLGLIAKTVAVLAWVHEPSDLVKLGWIQLVGSVGEIALAAVLVRISWPDVRLGWRSPLHPASRAAGRFGLKNLVMTSAERLIYDTDSIVVGANLGAAPVSVYNVGGTLARYARMLLGEVTRALGPTMSRLHAGGENEELRQTFLLMTRLTLLLALPVVFLGIAVADVLVWLWVGEGYEESARVLRILLIPLLLSAPSSVGVSLLWGMGRLRIPVILFSLEAVTNLGLSLWWIHRWGLTGVALGTLVPVVLLNAIWLPRAALRAIDMSISELWRGALWRPLVLCFPLGIESAILYRMQLASWPSFVLAAGLAVVLYALLIPWLGLSPEERAALRGWRRQS